MIVIISFSAVRTFPTHRMFSGETAAKISLFRVLMMYAQYNTTVGYCQGETYTCTCMFCTTMFDKASLHT